jgi:hypothetical protein
MVQPKRHARHRKAEPAQNAKRKPRADRCARGAGMGGIKHGSLPSPPLVRRHTVTWP